MNTIVVEVCLSATNDTIEFLLPLDRPLSELLAEMVKQIVTVKKNIRFAEKVPLVCDLDRHVLLDSSHTLAQANVSNGTRLLLC